jgi:hypothetical protein
MYRNLRTRKPPGIGTNPIAPDGPPGRSCREDGDGWLKKIGGDGGSGGGGWCYKHLITRG